MLQSEKDAENFYQAQAKFEQRQRMIDKGWGDRAEYEKLQHRERKNRHIQNIKNVILGGLMALFICFIVFGTNYVMHGNAI
jgi:hypothetical protein